MLKSKRSFRHPDFYRILASMRGVALVDERMASFDLIDESEAVVTLTGTVGFEALCRGTPVIVMGDAAYRSYPGVVDLYDRPMVESIWQMKLSWRGKVFQLKR
ncbi:capsular polysaccharide export protein, LipB/KpsS family [Marinobacter similis]